MALRAAIIHSHDDPPAPATKPLYPWPFCTMSTPAIRELARRIRTATALRLFLTLPDILDWQEWRMLNQATLGEELGIAQSHISTALRELLAIGIIERRGKGPRQEWKLSLDIGFRGNTAQFSAEALRQGKTFPKHPKDGRLNVAESILGEPDSSKREQPQTIITGKQKPNTSQRALNLLRPLKGGQEG